VLRVAVPILAALALVVPVAAHAKGKVAFEDTIPAGKSASVAFTVQKAASFRVVLRVPTQGRAKLFLTGATAPKGGPLIDTKTHSCDGAAGSFYCRASYEPLPKGTYRWRIAWSGPKSAHVELTVRW
jgi:hypothetical protein